MLTKKLLAKPALQSMLDLITPSFSISYLAYINTVEGLVRTLSIEIYCNNNNIIDHCE